VPQSAFTSAAVPPTNSTKPPLTRIRTPFGLMAQLCASCHTSSRAPPAAANPVRNEDWIPAQPLAPLTFPSMKSSTTKAAAAAMPLQLAKSTQVEMSAIFFKRFSVVLRSSTLTGGQSSRFGADSFFLARSNLYCLAREPTRRRIGSPRVPAVKTDVSNAASAQAMVNETLRTFDGLDCAFNNAGMLQAPRSITDLDEAVFDRVLAVDLKGVFLAMKYELRHMTRAKKGAIVNTASVAGLLTEGGLGAYVAAKHGVIGLTNTASTRAARARLIEVVPRERPPSSTT
jgi:hypothetical protein